MSGMWADLHVTGIVRGKKVAETHMASDGVPRRFVLEADDADLWADGADMTRVAFRLTDRYGKVLPFATGAVELTLDGPGTIVGPNPFALVAGVGAVYIRAGRKPGVVKLTAALPRHEAQTVSVRIRKT